MVGKPVSEKTRSKKSSNLVNGKIKIPKNVGTASASFGCTCNPKVTKKKSRKSKDSDIAITPSYISESNNVKVIDKVKIGKKSLKGKKSGEKNKGTKRGLQKNRAIDTLYSEPKPQKKKKKKKVGGDEGVIVVLEELNTAAGMKKRNNNGGKKEDGKLKGKEAKVKSPEKSRNVVSKRTEGKKKETVLAECKNDSRKKRVEEEEKKRTGKRRNQDENTKEKNKKRRKEEEEGKKQMKEKGKRLKEEGSAKEKKHKKVEVESKKVKKKKNKEKEIVMEEGNNVLYKFPMAQVSRMIKSEDINSKIAHEAVFVINKASVCTL